MKIDSVFVEANPEAGEPRNVQRFTWRGLVVDIYPAASGRLFHVTPVRVAGSPPPTGEDAVYLSGDWPTSAAMAGAALVERWSDDNSPAPVALKKRRHERLDGHWAVFNCHANYASERARMAMTAEQVAEIDAISAAHGGIMGIFNEPPNPATQAFVDLVTEFVNEDVEPRGDG